MVLVAADTPADHASAAHTSAVGTSAAEVVEEDNTPGRETGICRERTTLDPAAVLVVLIVVSQITLK